MLNDYGSPDGGAERQMLRLRDGLRADGHDAWLLASDAPLPGDAAGQTPSAADRHCRGATGRGQVVRSAWNRSAKAAVRVAVRALKPDVVHLRMFLWQLSPAVLDELADVPVLYHVAQYKSVCPTGQKRLPDGRACGVPAGGVCWRSGCVSALSLGPALLQQRLFRRRRGAIERTVLLSAAMEPVLRSGGYAGPVAVVPNGVVERPGRPALGGPPTVGFAGRLVPEKGVDVLLRAFARVRAEVADATLLVVGDGPQRAELERRAARLKVASAVAFVGHRTREAMETLLERAWVQATPSQWEEPFGNVSTEAMMRGTAVVASAVGGQSDIVADGQTGYLVPAADEDAWVDRLTRLLGDRAHAERMGAAGRERALTGFSEAATRARLVSIYEEMTR